MAEQTTTYTVGEARENFAEIINRVAFGGERLILTRHGKPIAAMVPASEVVILDFVREQNGR